MSGARRRLPVFTKQQMKDIVCGMGTALRAGRAGKGTGKGRRPKQTKSTRQKECAEQSRGPKGEGKDGAQLCPRGVVGLTTARPAKSGFAFRSQAP